MTLNCYLILWPTRISPSLRMGFQYLMIIGSRVESFEVLRKFCLFSIQLRRHRIFWMTLLYILLCIKIYPPPWKKCRLLYDKNAFSTHFEKFHKIFIDFPKTNSNCTNEFPSFIFFLFTPKTSKCIHFQRYFSIAFLSLAALYEGKYYSSMCISIGRLYIR